MIIYMCVLYRNLGCLQQLRAGLAFKCFFIKMSGFAGKDTSHCIRIAYVRVKQFVRCLYKGTRRWYW